MPLGDFVTLQRGHDLPEAKRRPGDTPVLGSFGVTGWHDTARAAGPGVTVGRSGASFGVVSYSPVDYWPLNTTLYVVDFHGNDQRFAYYFLKQLDFRIYNSGSAQPSLNRNFIHPIPVDIPPLHDQRAIARILGTLDDKIELNRRMNQTLEEMARALFKSWFVDFDPVRAKAALKQHALGHDTDPDGEPSEKGAAPAGNWTVERARAYLDAMDPRIADLFPDRLVDSELGEIPGGWEVIDLGSFGEVITGKTPSTRNSIFYGSAVPFLKIPDMHGKIYAVTTGTMLSYIGASSQPRKCLPAGSISISCIATPGLVILNHRETHTNQ